MVAPVVECMDMKPAAAAAAAAKDSPRQPDLR